MGSLHQLPGQHRHRHRHRRAGPPPTSCPACGGPIEAQSPAGAVYCSPECRIKAVKERHDVEVQSRLARVVQCIEMMATEVEGLIDVLAQRPIERGRRGRR